MFRRKPKTSKKKLIPRISTCSLCEKQFDWNITPALVNGAKKEFCGYECFKKNIENAVRHDYGADFDSL